MLLDYLWRYRDMKLRDKVKEIEPELVNDEYIGGVSGCPDDYEYLEGHYVIDYDNCHDSDKVDCEKCWSQEYIEVDNVNHPNHYKGKNECIDVMIAMFGLEAVKHFCMCNAYKYRFRADKKNGEEDRFKAEWYETKLIELGGVK